MSEYHGNKKEAILAFALAALLIGSVFVGAFTMGRIAYAQEAGDSAASATGSTSDPSENPDTSSDDSSSSPSSYAPEESVTEASTSDEESDTADSSQAEAGSTDGSDASDSTASDESESTNSTSQEATSSDSSSEVPNSGDGSEPTSTENDGSTPSMEQTNEADSSTSGQTSSTSNSTDSSDYPSSEDNTPPISSPELISDREAYSPGETAYISGIDFEPETTYDLYVFRGDGWIVKNNGEEGFDTLTTDTNGSFAYMYELPSVNGEWMVLIYESTDTDLNNLLARATFDVSAPTLSTDKYDYDPSETAIVSGKGFKSGTSYDILIERPDGSIIKGDGTFTDGYDSVTTNSLGRFTYSYILNGIPGNYMIYVYKSSDVAHEELIARGGFNDANSGPKFPSSATSSTWSTPASNALASDNICTSSSTNNQFIEITGFGFTSADIPVGATITTVQVEIDGAGTSNGNTQVQLITSPGTTIGSSVNHVLAGTCSSSTFATVTSGTPTWGASLSQAQVTSSGFGVRITQPNGSGTRSIDSVRITISFSTSISWEKRLETTGTPLNGPATFEVSPDPSDNVGIMTVVDNGAFDTDTDIGQITVNTIQLTTFTITEITPTTGTALDDVVTRSITVSASEANPVVGTQGVDDAGNTDESDFHNRLGSIEWEKRLEGTGTLYGGATFTISPDPSDGIGTMTVVDNGANDADADAGQLKVINARLASYIITETVAPVGTTLDDDATRSITVSSGDLNAVVGSALGSPPSTDDAGNTDESDFHNIPATVSVTFDASPAMADVAGTTAVLTVTIGGGFPVTVLKSEIPKTFTGIASGTTISYSYNSLVASTTTGKQYSWSSTAGTGSASGVSSQSGSFAITAASTVTATYGAQYQVTFDQSGLDGTETGTVVTVNGSSKTSGELPFTTAFVNSGTVITFDYIDPVASSVSGQQFRLDSISGGAEPSVTVTSPITITGTYVTQFEVTFNQTGLLADSIGTVVTVDGSPKIRTALPFSDFVDNGTAINFDYNDPVTSSLAGKQYRLTGITGGTEPSVTVSAPTTITGSYIEQFLVTFEETGLDGSTTGTLVTVDNVAQTSLPFSKYVDTGSSATYAFADPVDSVAPDKQFRLNSTTGPSSPITVTSPTTVTGEYVKQFLVTFEQTGLDVDATGTIATVDNVAQTSLPFSKYVDTGSAVIYSYEDPVASTINGKQYRLSSVSGPSSPITVTVATTVSASYVTQFEVTFESSGLDGSATGTVVTVDGDAKIFGDLPFSKYVDSGASVSFDYDDPVASSDADRQFRLDGMTGGSEPSITVIGDVTVTGNYVSQHKVRFDQTGLDASATGTVVTVNGTNLEFGDLPYATAFIDDGVVVVFAYTDPVTSSDVDRQFRLDSVNASSPISVSTAVTVVGDYQSQHRVRFLETGMDGSATGAVVTVDGDTKTLAELTFSKFVDDGTAVDYAYSDPVTSSVADKRFRLDNVTGPTSGFIVSAPVNVTGNYVVQYNVTFAYSGLDATATSTVVTINGSPKTFGDLPLTDWFDTGSTYAYSDPVSSSSPGSSFVLTGVTGQASPVSTSGTVTGNYFKTIVISGIKFNDINGNGIKDGTDAGLAGWTIYIDTNNNNIRDGTELFAVTDGSGNYEITQVGPGTHSVKEVLQSEWHQTYPAHYPLPPGSHTVTAVAGTNVAGKNFGNIVEISITGFYKPVDMDTLTITALNTVKAGSTVPLKFNLHQGGTQLTNISYILSITSKQVNCDGSASYYPIEEIVTTGGTGLRWDSTGQQFIDNWKTPSKAGICMNVTMTAVDGSTILAHFKTK